MNSFIAFPTFSFFKPQAPSASRHHNHQQHAHAKKPSSHLTSLGDHFTRKHAVLATQEKTQEKATGVKSAEPIQVSVTKDEQISQGVKIVKALGSHPESEVTLATQEPPKGSSENRASVHRAYDPETNKTVVSIQGERPPVGSQEEKDLATTIAKTLMAEASQGRDVLFDPDASSKQ